MPTKHSLSGAGTWRHSPKMQPGGPLPQQRPQLTGLATSGHPNGQLLAINHLIGTTQPALSKERQAKLCMGKEVQEKQEKAPETSVH